MERVGIEIGIPDGDSNGRVVHRERLGVGRHRPWPPLALVLKAGFRHRPLMRYWREAEMDQVPIYIGYLPHCPGRFGSGS